MQKNLLAKYRRHGSCKNGMEPVTTNVTAKTRDDLIYTLEEGEYELYKVVEIQEDGNFICRKFNISPKSFLRHPDLDFGKVGVFHYHGFHNILFQVAREDVQGKVFHFHSLLLTISRNVLAEK